MNDDLFRKLQLQETALQRAVRELQPLQNMVAEQNRIAQIIDPYRGMLEEAMRANRLIDEAIGQNGIADLVAQTVTATALKQDQN